MKKIMNWLGRSSAKKAASAAKINQNLATTGDGGEFKGRRVQYCSLHDIYQYPEVIANEYNHTTNQWMCYMCGMEDMNKGGEELRARFPQAFEIGSDTENLINKGYSGRLYLDQVQCPCGEHIVDHPETAAQCATSGTWTCSVECHEKYLKKPNLNTFHHNFGPMHQNKTMRSISLKVIRHLQSRKLAAGIPVCKTSRAFMFATLGDSDDHIFVQRGYRQYGRILDGTTQAIEVYEQEDLDYVMHQDRLCWEAEEWKIEKKYASLLNCRDEALDSRIQFKQDYYEGIVDKYHMPYCDWNCEFCKSGKVNQTFSEIDVITHCRKSEVALREGTAFIPLK